MEREIENRVNRVTKRSAKVLEETSGIQTHLEESEVEEYVRFVVKEREKMCGRQRTKIQCSSVSIVVSELTVSHNTFNMNRASILSSCTFNFSKAKY